MTGRTTLTSPLKAVPRSKLCAMIALLIGLVALGLSIYVLIACDFYEVSWTDPENGKTRTESPGLFNCKYLPREDKDNSNNDRNNNKDSPEAFTGPMNGFDMIPVIAGFAAAGLGLFAVFMLYMSHWKIPCCSRSSQQRFRNIGFSSCLFMMATICQSLTMLVLVSEACSEQHDGQCELLRNAYLSAGAAGGWFLASCFNREMVRPSTTGNDNSQTRGGSDELPK
mmetsp:Transcript_35190/g.85168  ORF Transcript_35190/g.85168 Transcript_35190/m.85168 type:complete len:225 (+) Transcript_35190:88-762(+)